MRKQALLLMTGGILAFASCNTETASGVSDAQVDSMVNARVAEIRLEMMRQNDSLINAMAQAKADSIITAMKGGGAVTTKTTTRTTTTKPKPGNDKEIKDIIEPSPNSGTGTFQGPSKKVVRPGAATQTGPVQNGRDQTTNTERK